VSVTFQLNNVVAPVVIVHEDSNPSQSCTSITIFYYVLACRKYNLYCILLLFDNWYKYFAVIIRVRTPIYNTLNLCFMNHFFRSNNMITESLFSVQFPSNSNMKKILIKLCLILSIKILIVLMIIVIIIFLLYLAVGIFFSGGFIFS
jgi:hypothetical protein